MNQDKQVDWGLIHAFKQGIDDGFFKGERSDMTALRWGRAELVAAYEQGYDHGVWLYCESIEGEKA
jgi:hypothetical protein